MIVEAISSFCTMIGKALGLIAQRDSEKNAADVKASKVAQQEQQRIDATTQAVAKQDIKEERREWSEN